VMIRPFEGGGQRMEKSTVEEPCNAKEKIKMGMFLKEGSMMVLEKVELLSFLCRGLFWFLVFGFWTKTGQG